MSNQEKSTTPEINRSSSVSPWQWMALGSGSTVLLFLSGFGAWTLVSQLLVSGKTAMQNQLSLASSSQRLDLNLPRASRQQISSDVPLAGILPQLKDREILVAVGDFQGNVATAVKTTNDTQKPGTGGAVESNKPTNKDSAEGSSARPGSPSPVDSPAVDSSASTTIVSDSGKADDPAAKSSPSVDDPTAKASSPSDSFDNISFDWGWNFAEGLAEIKVGEKWGYIDRTGYMIIKPRFQEARYFAEGLASIKTDDKWGYIDRTGKITILPKFQEAREFSEGFAAVKFDGKWGYIDNKGNFAVQPQYEAAEAFREGLASIKSGDLWGYIDPTGSTKIAIQFTNTWGFSQGVAQVKIGSRTTYINKDGKFISSRP